MTTTLTPRQEKLAAYYSAAFPALAADEAAGFAAGVPDGDTAAASRAAAAARDTHMGRAVPAPTLPPFARGTDAQKAAAERVRAAAVQSLVSRLREFEGGVADARSRPATGPDAVARAEARKAPTQAVLDTLAGVTDAGWWLDHRHVRFDSTRPELVAQLAAKAKGGAK